MVRAFSKQDFLDIMHDEKPRIIHFKTSHRSALRKVEGKGYLARFSIPFGNTIYPIFFKETKIKLIRNEYGLWLPIYEIAIYKKVSYFVKQYNDIVFIRDALNMSCSIDKNMKSPDPLVTGESDYTEIGRLEYEAKYQEDTDALDELVRIVDDFIHRTPIYKNADMIIAVPSSKVGTISLTQSIVNRLATLQNPHNTTNAIKWCKNKPPLKTVSVQEKWDLLEQTKLCVQRASLIGKRVILLDDMYQSGTTLNYIGRKILQAGARAVYGLALVKSLSNTDNIHEGS